MIIKNLNPNGEQFENRDFWLINVLTLLEAMDRNLSTIRTSANGVEYVKKKVLKDNCMEQHLLIIDDMSLYIIFHPSLAKHFIKSRGIQFLTDAETPQ